MAAAFTPTRKYGLHGDICYFTQTMLTEDGDHIWQVVVMKSDHDIVAGEYWYEESQLIVLPSVIDLETGAAIDDLERRAREIQESKDIHEVEDALRALDEIDPCQMVSDEYEAQSIVLRSVR